MASPSLIHTPRGPIEASITGTGPPILILHGSPGGIDASRSMSQFLSSHNTLTSTHTAFKLIHLSRPGYLNTPLSPTHHSINDEADLILALLNTLSVERVGVLAWSGGGAVAYQFASRYPGRVSSMVVVAGCSGRWIAPKTGVAERIVFGTRFGEEMVRYLVEHYPRHVVETALKNEGSLRGGELHELVEQVMSDAAQRQLVLDAALTMNVGGQRKEGWENDVKNFAGIERLGLEEVQCPVLLVHGGADTDAVLRHSEVAHERLPNSELVIMESGTHLSFYAHPKAREVQEKAKRWFLEHAGC